MPTPHKLPRFNVRMRLKVRHGSTPAGTWVILTVRDRCAWSKRHALRHLRDVRTDPKFTQHYDAFELAED